MLYVHAPRKPERPKYNVLSVQDVSNKKYERFKSGDFACTPETGFSVTDRLNRLISGIPYGVGIKKKKK